MTSIRNIFDADALELHDLRADPNTVIKIQELVKEMIEGNANRCKEIYRQILEEYKAAALPGVISATYVLADQLNNRRRQQIVADLMYELCRENLSAQRLLLRAGIVENPFDVSRSVAAQALNQLDGFQICPDDKSWLFEEVHQLVGEEEREAVLAILEILLVRGIGYDEAKGICHRWFESPYTAKEPAKLMNLLLKTHPNQTEDTLVYLFTSLERTDDEAGRVIKEFVDLGSPEAIVPAIRASSRRLDRERTGRAKPVEFLFEGAIARQIVENPEYISTSQEYILTERLNDGIPRYWWQALSSAVKLKSEKAKRYFEDTIPELDEDFALWGVVQLMFLESGSQTDKETRAWAKQVLEDLKMQNLCLYQQAEEKKEMIISGTPIKGRDRGDNPIVDI